MPPPDERTGGMNPHKRRDPGAQAPGLDKSASDGGSPTRVADEDAADGSLIPIVVLNSATTWPSYAGGADDERAATLVDILGPLDGARISGGCDYCDAYQESSRSAPECGSSTSAMTTGAPGGSNVSRPSDERAVTGPRRAPGSLRHRSKRRARGRRPLRARLAGLPLDRPRRDVVEQVRPDDPGDGPKYLFPKDAAAPLWVHPRIRDRVGNVKTVVFVEGTKQYLAAVSAAADDVLVVGLAGCWGWSHDGMPT